jgi:hypothetical protein
MDHDYPIDDARELFRVVADTSSDGVISVDHDSVILFANPAVERVFGFRSEMLRKRRFQDPRQRKQNAGQHIQRSPLVKARDSRHTACQAWVVMGLRLCKSASPLGDKHIANASRRSRSLGGLLSTRSTWGGTSPSAIKRCPHPVRRITGVDSDAFFTKLATLRPSTRGMPKSVITTANGFPCPSAARNESIPC